MADDRTAQEVDQLFRHSAGRMVATLTRILGLRHLDLAEDVVQEALVQALRVWPYQGVPDNAAAWLTQVAKRKALDVLRRDATWQRKTVEIERAWPSSSPGEGEAVCFDREIDDDPLRLIFACCDPRLSRDAQTALTLKTVGGFSTAEIARAFLTRESTVAQRIVRAKRALRSFGSELQSPSGADLESRLAAVCEVVYLTFNEGSTASGGDEPLRGDLCAEALRLAELLAGHPWTRGPRTLALEALLLLHAARLPARIDPDGELLLLREQDRSRWNGERVRRGLEALRDSASGSEITPYHLEAEIAACHALAGTWEDTDWARIVDCYDSLLALQPSPVVALNRLVALAELRGARRALLEGRALLEEPALAEYPPAAAVRAVLEAEAGCDDEARRSLSRALALATSPGIRRALLRRARASGVVPGEELGDDLGPVVEDPS